MGTSSHVGWPNFFGWLRFGKRQTENVRIVKADFHMPNDIHIVRSRGDEAIQCNA